jgi:hypothetical protein
MQTQTSTTHPALRARAVPGRHAKGPSGTDSRARTAHRILITAVLLGSVAAGSAAVSEYAMAASHANAHHHAAAPIVKNPWMY